MVVLSVPFWGVSQGMAVTSDAIIRIIPFFMHCISLVINMKK